MDAHNKGVNYVDFYPGADKPYLDNKTESVGLLEQELCSNNGRPHS
jgi:hypothetical protein